MNINVRVDFFNMYEKSIIHTSSRSRSRFIFLLSCDISLGDLLLSRNLLGDTDPRYLNKNLN